jgi:c-di-GMP-related signal transduction protein
MAYMVEELPNKHQSLSPNLTNAKKKKKKKKMWRLKLPKMSLFNQLNSYYSKQFLESSLLLGLLRMIDSLPWKRQSLLQKMLP